MNIFLTGVQLNKKGFMVATIPYFPLFTWYYIFSNDILKFIVGGYTKTFFIFNASFNFLASFTLIMSNSFIRRIDKTSVIFAWSLLSSIITIFIALVPTDTLKLAMYLSLGVIFGIGLLAFFTFFWDLTVPEERGRVAGLAGFIFLPVFRLVPVFVKNLDLLGTSVLCIIVSLGTLGIRLLNAGKMTLLTAKKDLKGYNPEKRTILFYLIPWVIFSLINATLAKAYSFHASQFLSPSSLTLLGTLQVIGGSLGAMLGGVIADFFGRRLSLTFGLTLYGVSSAISGFTNITEMFYLASLGIGLSWGILLTLYLFLIWGDLADIETCSRNYSVGLAIFYLATAVGFLFSPELLQIPLIVASITSCLLIFLSNIPLILTPELLPSDFREKFRLRLYIYLVKRKKLKHL